MPGAKKASAGLHRRQPPVVARDMDHRRAGRCQFAGDEPGVEALGGAAEGDVIGRLSSRVSYPPLRRCQP